jgi:tetratricopeptide (TPR) repeat protein
MKRYDEALPDFSKAIELDPQNARYYNQRAVTLHAMKRYDEALSDFNKAIELDPQSRDYYDCRAIIYSTLSSKATDPAQIAEYRRLAKSDESTAARLHGESL